MAPPRPIVTCTGCGHNKPHHGYGWCRTCYHRWYRAGRPDDGPPPSRSSNGTCPATEDYDIDDVAVLLAVNGEHPALNPAERRAAIAVLRKRGLSLTAIGDRLGCAPYTVSRHVAALRAQTGA